MDHKAFRHVEIKSADRGEVSAVFSTFNVIDSDGDVTLPGAFTDGAELVISSYGHTSWGGALPVGKGRIRMTAKEAIVDGQFFMDTTSGRDTFSVVKQLGPLGQWSYGYDVMDSDPGVFNGTDVRFLKSLLVHEASPVLVGAGVNTRTLDAKSATHPAPKGALMDFKAFNSIKAHETPCTKGRWDEQAVIDALADDVGIDGLRSMFAYVNGDPEQKASYLFAHHDRVDGPANIRAIVLGIARLNDAKGANIPDGDRKAVYEHLVSHLRDVEYDPLPELRSGTDELKLSDELASALAGVAAARKSASRVVALRAAKGKALSRVNVELLDWLHDEMRELRTQIDTPSDDLAREFVRFVQSQTGA